MRPGGYVQVLRQPFARWCEQLRYDERALLLWLLVEANRRRRNPVLAISKTTLTETFGIGWRRLSRLLARLVEVDAIVWEPGIGGRDGHVVVLAYPDVVADGRRETGPDYAQLSCDDVDDDLERLGFDAWALLVLVALEVGSVTRSLTGPAAGIARHLGLDRHRLPSLAKRLAAAGEVAWHPGVRGGGSACARVEVLDYVRMVASTAAEHDRGEVRVGLDGEVVKAQSATQKAESADGSGWKARTVRRKARTAPAPSGPSLEAQEEHSLEAQPPQPPQCSTPPEPKAKNGGMLPEAPQVLLDQEHPLVDVFLDELLDAVSELAEDTGDDRSGPRLAHALARSTPGIHLLRVRASERLAAGWTPWNLAVETVGTWDLLSASHVDAVLASRLDALPLDPPERVENEPEWSPPIVVIEGEPPDAAYGPFVTSPIADEPAIDVFDAVFGSGSRPRAPELSRGAIDVEATPSAHEMSPERRTEGRLSASIEPPGAMPASDVDQGADERLCDVPVSAVASLGDPRKVIDLDVDEAIARACAVVGAMGGGSRSERGRRPFGAPDELPRPAFGPPTSLQRPVDARLSPSEGSRGVTAPEAPERGADGDAAQARADRLRAKADEQERIRERLRPYGLSA